MLTASSRCRASFLRLHPSRRNAAFLSPSNDCGWKHRAQAARSTMSYLSSYARLQSDDNDDLEDRFLPRARQAPLKPPPIRARPMPPTLEESSYYESTNISPEFPDFDVSATAQEYDIYDYDPNADNTDSYGFFTNDEEEEVMAPVAANGAARPEETVPTEDPYMFDKQQEDVPNPHNYWEDDTDETTVDEKVPSTTAQATKAQDEVTPPPEPKLKSQTTLPTRVAMPPRSTFASQPPPLQGDRHGDDIYAKASSGDAITAEVEMLTTQLDKLQQDIYAQNNHKEFNIKSTKQVSQVLFGQPGQSTNKGTLEAMGGAGNVMADLILQYRSLSRKILRLTKKQQIKTNGTLVKNVSVTRRKQSNTVSKASKSGKATADAAANHDGVVEGDPLLLVDASAYIFRAYYSMPPLHRADGMPVGAVLGFCNMLNRLVLSRMIQGECPRLVLVFDAKGKTFRHDLYDDYKANRPECPMDLVPQFDLIRQAAEAYGIQQLEAPSYEADDVIATLATMALNEGVDTNILSGDKDLMQLITPQDEFPSIQMVDPMTMSHVSHDVVVEKWGVTPDKLGDVLALAGDSADNVPGVPGIGPKIAATLIGEYGSLDKLLDQVDTIKQKGRRQKLMENVENARLSRELVELERELPLNKMTFPENITSAAELRMAPLDSDRLLAFYQEMGLKDAKRRVEARLKQQKATRRKNGNRRAKAEIPKPEDYKDVPF